MNAARWKRIERLYHRAEPLDAARRATYLDDKCEGDPELRREVESLLGQSVSSADIFRKPPGEEHAPPAAIGSFIGPFEILGIAGKGGMATVFRARDSRLKRTVALKVIHREFADLPEFRKRFQREAHASSALNHPNICRLYDIGEAEIGPYLVLEFSAGETLSALTGKQPMTLERVLRFGIQVASALVAAHKAGIMHRDIKPANIMVKGDFIQVLDFGLAGMLPESNWAEGTLTFTNAVMGTPSWMSPEQREGKRGDARTDVYGFGLVLQHMIHGLAVPAGVRALIARCLAERPEERPQTAAELLRQLEQEV